MIDLPQIKKIHYITCYYDEHDKSGNACDDAIRIALSQYPAEDRRKIQVLCLPESFRKRTKKNEQMQTISSASTK